jgi:class 3 adenylate cyclase
MPWLQLRAATLLPCFLLLLFGLARPSLAQVVLDSRADSIDLWPSVSILRNAAPELDANTALVSRSAFSRPQSAHATLGFAEPVIWMRVPVENPAASPVMRVLTMDYALLHFVEVYVAAAGPLQAMPRVGNKVPRAERPIAGRNHALEVVIPPGASELLIRVESPGSKILPMYLSTWPAYHHGELIETMVQGLLASLALWLLFYSLLQWRVLQEPLYLKYGLLIVASAFFSIHFFGIGEQYIWGDNHWIENHLAGLSALVASCATALFVEDALRQDSPSAMRKALFVLAGFLALCALAHALDLIGIRSVGVVMGSFGLMPVLFGIPGAVRRLKRGDPVGGWFLLAWTGYLIGSAVMVGVVKGSVGANFWTLHSFQAAATIDMLIFMQIAVIGTRRMKEELAAERRQFFERQKTELEVKVVERTAELARERQRAEALLLHILPPAIAEELKTSGACEPKRHEEVSVLFTDLVDFTRTVATIPPQLAVSELNDIFTAFDGSVAEYGLEKINTVGDAYMAAAGVPHAVPDHAARAVRAALAMQAYIAHRNEHAKVQWQLRAGIHSGPVVAGVVGSTKYAYGIWGDTVNVASRMESHSAPGRVNISATTRTGVKGIYNTQYRGKLEAKGKGEIDMYFITGTTDGETAGAAATPACAI